MEHRVNRREKKLADVLERSRLEKQQREERLDRLKILQTDKPGFLETEGNEKSYRIKQDEIVKHLEWANASKHIELRLKFGPYKLDLTKNGKYILIGGTKGHVASFEWKTGRFLCERNFQEKINDLKWLHNETLFAVSQNRSTYVYDMNGVELHNLRCVPESKLEFLYYHLLLVMAGKNRQMEYFDISVGRRMAMINMKSEPLCVKQNPQNGIIHVGHEGGTVTMWSPQANKYLVKMLCHKGPLGAIDVSHCGNYMVTSGQDCHVKIWDIRTYKELYRYITPLSPEALALSQRGLLSISFGARSLVMKDVFMKRQKNPYITHTLEDGGSISDTLFCPHEDIMFIGHSKGIENIFVPGAGEPNFDSLENNPFETKEQRKETEIKLLLNKIPTTMITMDNSKLAPIKNNETRRKKTVKVYDEKPKVAKTWSALGRFVDTNRY